jgi:3-(3-hydroxy-phenyl)propionate hydroxylase
VPGVLMAEVFASRARGLPVRVVAIGASQRPGGADLVLPDSGGCVARRYGVTGPGAAYLLRPDHHVCARWTKPDAARLREALARASGNFQENQA